MTLFLYLIPAILITVTIKLFFNNKKLKQENKALKQSLAEKAIIAKRSASEQNLFTNSSTKNGENNIAQTPDSNTTENQSKNHTTLQTSALGEQKFIEKLTAIIRHHITNPHIDVNFLATELSMSRSKLYSKVKSITNKSIVEFILEQRLQIAAQLMIEEDLTIQETMKKVGIKSQSYFTKSFKKEYGETPAVFTAKHRKEQL